MKIILKENIENLGKRGDIVNVAAGFGRNYLIPKKMALQVTPSNIKMIEMEQKALRKKLEKEISSYNEIIERLNQTTLTFTRKVGEKESLFGSVNVSDIKEALDKAGFEIEKRKILLSEPIKKLGQHSVSLKVFHDDRAEVKIDVVGERAEEKTEKPKEEVSATPNEQEPIPADESTTSVSTVEEKKEKDEDPADVVEPGSEDKEAKTEDKEAKTEDKEAKTEDKGDSLTESPKEPEEETKEKKTDSPDVGIETKEEIEEKAEIEEK